VSTAFIKINEVPFLKIEFKSVIEAIDVSSTKKHFQHFHAFRHFWGGQSVPEAFYSYLQNNVAFRASFLWEVGSCKNGFPSAKASAFKAPPLR
jgi:hypothetical protein